MPTRPARPGPTVFVLFGATGDLAKRMVLPSFFELATKRLLPARWLLVGNGMDADHFDFPAHVHQALVDTGTEFTDAQWRAFAPHLRFAAGPLVPGEDGLVGTVEAARRELGDGTNLIHYLAIPPQAFGQVTRDLGAAGLSKGARVIYEKPFGTSQQSFQTLQRTVGSVLEESQIYRIDHFLGKQATQELHILRFANGLFDAMWSREHVRAVQIDVPERIGMTDRSVFYDATGVVLDMLVTHLFQVAAEVAMEAPAALDSAALQTARESIITRFRPLDPAQAVLGQFAGYRELDGVKRNSRTPTFVAATLWVNTPRWRDVPFLLRTGKRMPVSKETVSLILREPPGPLAGIAKAGNVLSFDLAGDGAIDLRLVAERPDADLTFGELAAHIPLDDMARADPLPPYARLIHDALIGDRSLFTRPDGLAATWRAVGPLLNDPPRLQRYAAGSWGPTAARKLAAPDGWLLGD